MQPRPNARLSSQAMAFVLAGGRGSRLKELTDRRAKPAVYFGGKTRIIDFALSNALNSGIRKMAIATQYKAHSLIRHVQRGWNFFLAERNEYLDILPASQRMDEVNWDRGRAYAMAQNIESTDRKGLMAVDDAQVQAGRILPASHPGAVRHPDGQSVLAGQAEDTAHMIAMLMGNHDTGQIGGMLAETQHAGGGFPQPEAAIEHQTGFPRLDKQRVTGAAAAERGETDHCNCWRSRPRIFLAVSDLSVPPSADSTLTTLCCPSSLT